MILRRESLAGVISVVAEYCPGRVNFVNSCLALFLRNLIRITEDILVL